MKKRYCASVGLLMLALFVRSAVVEAHSASDAYLSLTAEHEPRTGVVLRGQWDIALRDLDFVLHLDDDGDGKLTWGEVRHHLPAIQRYANAALHFDGGAGNSCSIKPTRQMIDDHADGAYAALFFEVACTRVPSKLTLDYSLFFAIDPSHRGIFVMQSGGNTATALLSPENARIQLAL
jgi:hypothetical protein